MLGGFQRMNRLRRENQQRARELDDIANANINRDDLAIDPNIPVFYVQTK
jgi:hypothetical protein